MEYKLKIEYVEAYEVIASLIVYQNRKEKYDYANTIVQALKKTENNTLLITKLEQLEHRRDSGYLLMLVHLAPQKASFTAVISWLEKLTIGEIYELLAPYLEGELPDLHALKQDYIEILPLWYENYKIDKEVHKLLELEALKYRTDQSVLSSIDLVEKATNGIRFHPAENRHELILIPTFHMAPLNRVYGLKNTIIILFTVEADPVDNLYPSDKLLRKIKVLSDENRLRIVQLLATEEKTFTEIGKLMKLSKSNLHYHLTMLRSSGIIRIHNYSFSEPDKYELRPGVFEALKVDLEDYVYKQ